MESGQKEEKCEKEGSNLRHVITGDQKSPILPSNWRTGKTGIIKPELKT